MKLPRRQFLHLAAGAAALPALSRFAVGHSPSDAAGAPGLSHSLRRSDLLASRVVVILKCRFMRRLAGARKACLARAGSPPRPSMKAPTTRGRRHGGFANCRPCPQWVVGRTGRVGRNRCGYYG